MEIDFRKVNAGLKGVEKRGGWTKRQALERGLDWNSLTVDGGESQSENAQISVPKTPPSGVGSPRWVKGQSGNPKGKPKMSLNLTARLKKYLLDHPKEIEGILQALIDSAKSGNVSAATEILNRVDGKVAEPHKLEGSIPVTLIFKPYTPMGHTPLPAPSITVEAKELPASGIKE